MSSVIKHFSAYSLAICISVPLAIVSLFLLTKMLGPSLYGIFASLSLFLLYSRYFDFGLSRGILKEIPKVKNIKKQNALFSSSMFSVLLLFTLLGMLLLGVTLGIGLFPKHRLALILLFVVMIIQQVWLLLENYLKATKKISTLSISTIIMAAIKIPLIVLMVYLFSLTGAMLMLVIVYILAIIFMSIRAKISLFPKFNVKSIKKILKTGFPILLIDLVTFLLLTIDKVLIGIFIGTEQLGYYNIGFLTINYFLFLPTALGFILLPRMISESKKNAKQYYLQSIKIFSFVSPLIFGSMFLLLPGLITRFLPDFMPAILSMKILLLAAFFFSISIIGNNYLLSQDLQKKLIIMQVISLITLITLDIVALSLGYGIETIAAIALIVYLLLSKKICFMCTTHIGIKNHTLFIARQYLPLMFMFLLCALLEKFKIVKNMLGNTTIITIIFVICYIGFFMHLNKRLGILPKKAQNK